MRRCEDEKIWRCKMRRWEDEKTRRCEDEKMRRREDVKMRRCEDVKMRRWEDVKMWRWHDVKMWRWEDVRMRRCEGEKMRRWEDEKMWRWEDVMTRCDDRSPLLEEPFTQTLSGKRYINDEHWNSISAYHSLSHCFTSPAMVASSIQLWYPHLSLVSICAFADIPPPCMLSSLVRPALQRHEVVEILLWLSNCWNASQSKLDLVAISVQDMFKWERSQTLLPPWNWPLVNSVEYWSNMGNYASAPWSPHEQVKSESNRPLERIAASWRLLPASQMLKQSRRARTSPWAHLVASMKHTTLS